MMDENQQMTPDTDDLVPTVVVTDENGVEKEYDILATFESEEGAEYVLYYDQDQEDDEDGTVYAARVENTDGEAKLVPIETEEEWAMVDEVLDKMEEGDE